MPLSHPGHTLGEAERALERWGRVALCQIVRTQGSTPGKVGWKLLVPPTGDALGNLGGGAFEALVEHDARALLALERPRPEVKRYYLTERAARGEPTGMVCGGFAEIFLEVLMADPVLVIYGGGPVGQALAANGALCGFDPLVVEDRAEFRRPDLFPTGTRIESVDRGFGVAFLEELAGRELYVTVVTRCWETDLTALESVLRRAPESMRYLGLLGSGRKVERVKNELRSKGFDPDSAGLQGPIGLPIGGETPGEIAVSVLAEIIAVRRRDDGEAGSGEERSADSALSGSRGRPA